MRKKANYPNERRETSQHPPNKSPVRASRGRIKEGVHSCFHGTYTPLSAKTPKGVGGFMHKLRIIRILQLIVHILNMLCLLNLTFSILIFLMFIFYVMFILIFLFLYFCYFYPPTPLGVLALRGV